MTHNHYRLSSYPRHATSVFCVVTPAGAILWRGPGLVAREVALAICDVLNAVEQRTIQSRVLHNRACASAEYLQRMGACYAYPAIVGRAVEWLLIAEGT